MRRPNLARTASFVFVALVGCLWAVCALAAGEPLISNVSLSPETFNPSMSGAGKVVFRLSRDASVTFSIYGPEGERVARVFEKKAMKAGENQAAWDGKDAEGAVVPDEAYAFVLEAVDRKGVRETFPAGWERTTWKETIISEIGYDRQRGVLRYSLPGAGRVLVRAGVSNGPMLTTMVDWAPKPKGDVVLQWDGWDSDRVVDIAGLADMKVTVSAYVFPWPAFVTFGNTKTAYADYRKDRKAKKGEVVGPATTPKPLWQMRSPAVEVSLPVGGGEAGQGAAAGTPVLQGRAIVKVNVDKADRSLLDNTKYEIMFFLDQGFYSEEPIGTTPFNWLWDLKGIKAGRHLLTVNFMTMRGQVSAKSIVFEVAQP